MEIRTPGELLTLAKDGNIIVTENLTILCDIPREYGKKIRSLNCRGDLNCEGNLYWSHACKPLVKGTLTHGKVLPPEWQRKHWEDRLGISMEGCYEEILLRVQAQLPKLLRRKCWSETERWILESLNL